MSLKPIAMVVVRKKMKKMRMVCVCVCVCVCVYVCVFGMNEGDRMSQPTPEL